MGVVGERVEGSGSRVGVCSWRESQGSGSIVGVCSWREWKVLEV